MSEKRGFSQRWGHLLLGGVIGGFVGAAADDLASWLFPASELAATIAFSAVTGEEASSATWADFPVSIGVRPPQ